MQLQNPSLDITAYKDIPCCVLPPLSHNTTVGNANSAKCALYFLLLSPASQVLATLLNVFLNIWVETFPNVVLNISVETFPLASLLQVFPI